MRTGSGRNRQAIVLLFLVSITGRMHLKVRYIYGKHLIFGKWRQVLCYIVAVVLPLVALHHCCVLRLVFGNILIVVVSSLPPFLRQLLDAKGRLHRSV